MGRRRDRLADKNVSITGSGARKTRILAPQTLVAGEDGGTSIVEIHNGASAALSQQVVRLSAMIVDSTVTGHRRLSTYGIGFVAGAVRRVARSTVSMALRDGSCTVRDDRIGGGVGGVAVVAASADAKTVLDGPRIKRTSGAPVRTFEWCGFTATATGQP
ncbi:MULTISPECIES: hypothetical protein [Streptomyces]|uniref:hypothetical protein n=1 Tax=Streptomyces TaxID=1883 RepID=UPI001C307A6D|nr:hypothetical protein [Streptomyces sp. GbtcB7]